MKTIIINGSPKGQNGNSEIFIREFLKNMKFPCEVKYVTKEDPRELARYVEVFNNIVIVLPLYVHSVPGVTMKFIECLKQERDKANNSIGFILQCGFSESSQCKYAEAYFKCLAKDLNRNYLGTVTKSGAAGTYLMPRAMNRTLFKFLNELGEKYEKNNTFDKDIMEKLKKPYELKGFNLKVLQFLTKIGYGDIWWNSMLKKNGAYDKRLDKPFI